MFLDAAGSASSLAHISAAQAQRLGSSRCLGGLAVEQTRLERREALRSEGINDSKPESSKMKS